MDAIFEHPEIGCAANKQYNPTIRLKTAAIIFGIFFIVDGIGGFVSALAPNGTVRSVHGRYAAQLRASGVRRGGVLCAANAGAARKYFQIFGIVYALVAVAGFFYGNSPLLGMIAHNTMDIWLHIGIAEVSLYLGFVAKEEGTAARSRA